MSRFGQWLRRRTRTAGVAREIRKRKREAALREIDRLSEAYRGKIPYMEHFRKALIPGVWRSLRYVRGLVRCIPGPVPFDPERWGSDPILNAMYVSSANMNRFLQSEEALLRFFSETDAQGAFALLQSVRREKTVSGTRRDGTIVRRDVLQKAVFFEEHRMTAVADRFESSRSEVCHLLLNRLFRQAVSQIEDLRQWKKELDREHDRMELLMRPEKHVDGSTSATEEEEDRLRMEAQKLHDAIEQKLADIETSLDDPEDYLGLLEAVLHHPGKWLSVRPVFMELSRLGIRLEADSPEPANRFTLAEFREGTRKRWSAVWVRIARSAVHGR